MLRFGIDILKWANTLNTYSACSGIVTLTEIIKCMPILDNTIFFVNVVYIIILSMLTLPLKKTIVCGTADLDLDFE